MDWNSGPFYPAEAVKRSQPARAVWIEISLVNISRMYGSKSQPARVVWIEIQLIRTAFVPSPVTACEDCVDWNLSLSPPAKTITRHSLRGLCGLKSKWIQGRKACRHCHSLQGLCVLEIFPVPGCPAGKIRYQGSGCGKWGRISIDESWYLLRTIVTNRY